MVQDPPWEGVSSSQRPKNREKTREIGRQPIGYVDHGEKGKGAKKGGGGDDGKWPLSKACQRAATDNILRYGRRGAISESQSLRKCFAAPISRRSLHATTAVIHQI
jgi:hypothetical protein